MPRTKGDHEARRRDVSEAVWQVMATRGFAGLTLRAVAAELGATTGLLTHYFPTKRALVAYALDLLEQRTIARPRRPAGKGLIALRHALMDVLPLTPEAADSNRIWVSSWDAALTDGELSADYARKYAQSRDKLRDRVAAAQELGELLPGNPAHIAAGAQSFTLGLVVQALFDPAAFPPQRQVELLDDYLATLTDKAKSEPPQPHRERRGEQESGSPARTWHAMDVTCPKCDAVPNAPCTPHGTHHERVEWAKEFTRKLWG